MRGGTQRRHYRASYGFTAVFDTYQYRRENDGLTIRFLATTHVRNGQPMKIGKVDMPLRVWLFVVFFAVFPVVSVIGELGPGRWANELQDALVGLDIPGS